jgi:hypothetical protein
MQTDLHEGGVPIRRGRGRPPSPARKVAIKFRLDPDLVAKLRASGPGYQTRVNAWLREAVFGIKQKARKAHEASVSRRVDKLARKVAIQVKPNAKTKAAARTIMRRMARDKAAAKRRQQRAKARV